jgi:hypothetical protein
MPIIRKHAVQGHYVPRTAAPARGPFPAEIFAANPRAEEHFPKGDSLHEAYDNIRYFRCKDCGDIMLDTELDDHICVDNVWELGSNVGFADSGEDSSDLSLTIGMSEGRPLHEFDE